MYNGHEVKYCAKCGSKLKQTLSASETFWVNACPKRLRYWGLQFNPGHTVVHAGAKVNPRYDVTTGERLT